MNKTQEPDEPEKKRLPRLPEKLEPSESLQRLSGIGLPVALGISVAVALLLIGVSMSLYLNSNLSRIDLSKPKYADARIKVEEFPEKEQEYSDEGPVNQESIREAIKLMEERRKELKQIGDFTDSALDDKTLELK